MVIIKSLNHMYYISSYDVKEAIKKCLLDKKYSLSSSQIDCCIRFIDAKYCRGSPYQKLSNRFLLRCKKYINENANSIPAADPSTQILFDDFIKQTCNKELYIFRICNDHKLDDFESCKFLTDFFGQSIDHIIEIFDYFNMSPNMAHKIKNNNTFNLAIKKILTIYMIINLAQSFKIISMAINSDCLEALELFNHYSVFKLFYNTYHQCLLNGDEINNNVSIELAENIIEMMHSNINPEIVQRFINSSYNGLKNIFNFFHNNNFYDVIKYCDKKPDMAAIIAKYFSGKQTKNTIENNFILKFIVKLDNLILENFIFEHELLHDMNQIKNLKLPTDQININVITIEI